MLSFSVTGAEFICNEARCISEVHHSYTAANLLLVSAVGHIIFTRLGWRAALSLLFYTPPPPKNVGLKQLPSNVAALSAIKVSVLLPNWWKSTFIASQNAAPLSASSISADRRVQIWEKLPPDGRRLGGWLQLVSKVIFSLRPELAVSRATRCPRLPDPEIEGQPSINEARLSPPPPLTGNYWLRFRRLSPFRASG